jgi:polyhydroxybutyrate depolymerase
MVERGAGSDQNIQETEAQGMIGLFRLAMLAALLVFGCDIAPAQADTIEAGGVTRTFAAQLAEQRPAPLVIVLHGNLQTGADMALRTSWPQVARREHFSVVFPDGLNRAWADLRSQHLLRTPPAGTDDVGFIAALIGKLVADGVADPKRVYVTGISNGGAMTMRLVCERAGLFTAAATVVINLSDEQAEACHPSRPVPMLMINGTADPLVPYEGGQAKGRFAARDLWSTGQTLAFWRRVNGCEDRDASVVPLEDRDRNDQSTVTAVSSHCPAGRGAMLYRVNGGGHRMPGWLPDSYLARAVTLMLGPQNRDIDGAETIWEFFRKFP